MRETTKSDTVRRERERERQEEQLKTGQDQLKWTNEALITIVNWRPSFSLSPPLHL